MRSWASIDRRRASYRRVFRKVFQDALQSQIKPFIDDISTIDVSNTFYNEVEIDNSKVEQAYTRLYKTVAKDFAKKERETLLKAAGKPSVTKDGFDDEMELLITEYLTTGQVGRNIVSISQTSKEYFNKLLNDLIVEVNAEGLGYSEAQTRLRDRLTSEWHRAARYRTERIVRTEVSAASNWGSIKGVNSTGLPYNKTWLAAIDERTRVGHADANGQTVDQYDAFTVDGEMLEYPVDPAGSAGNVINCRCSVTYQLKQMSI